MGRSRNDHADQANSFGPAANDPEAFYQQVSADDMAMQSAQFAAQTHCES